MRQAFKVRKYCLALFIDVSEAFVKIWHDDLISKLAQNRPLNTHNLLRTYLTGWNFAIGEEEFRSDPQQIEAGVS